MKRLWTGIAALALCALVALTAAAPARGAGSVYFMAVNDQLLELSSATMPITEGGTLYVPYTMLSANASGVNLGVYATYSAAAGRVLVFSNRKQLVFDLQANLTYDMNGVFYSERAILRNSTVFQPIARVCDVFRGDIYYTVSRVELGYLVRVRNSAAELGDEAFIDAAANMMRTYLNRYLQSQPDPSPAASAPAPVASQPISGNEAWAYLAFTLPEEGGAVGPVLSALDLRECRGLFFLTPEQLEEEDDLVRRLLGSGHLVGARVSAADPADALAQLERAADTLSAVAHCRLDLVLAEGLDGDALAQLERAGYVCWQTTADGRGMTGSASSQASALLREMDRERGARNYLLLDDGVGEVLASLLSALERGEIRFGTPVASVL